MTSTDHRHRPQRTSAVTRRRVGAATLVLSAAVTFAAPAAESQQADAAIADATELVMTTVRGTVVGRGAAPAPVEGVVANRGTRPATGVAVRYRLPSGIEAAATPGCTTSGSLVTCAVGTLAAGATARVAINVAESNTSAAVGVRAGYFLPPTSDGFDLGAGEVSLTSWNHEAGAEGTPLQECWPVSRATPNMDVAGGTCDGTVDAAPLAASADAVTATFPPAFNERVVRSWEFRTRVTAPLSGSFVACGINVDDGGYFALVPAGQAFTDSSVLASTTGFDSFTSSPFRLTAAEQYDVLIRVSNRGQAGVDNGDDGLAGWIAFGISDAALTCNAASASVFGTADASWIERTPADVEVRTTSDLAVTGLVESDPRKTERTTSVRVANLGAETSAGTVNLQLPAGTTAIDGLSGCVVGAGRSTAVCAMTPLAPGDSASTQVRFRGTSTGASWSTSPIGSVDVVAANDAAPR